jgi:hypothetical protein
MNRSLALALVVSGACNSLAHADATLVYELTDTDARKTEKTFSVSRFFVRVDSSDAEGEHLLFQAGKFFPLYSVNEKEGTYSRLTPPVEARLGPKAGAKSPERQSSASGVEGETQDSVEAEAAPKTALEGQDAGPSTAGQEPETGEHQAAAQTGDAVPEQGVAEGQPKSAQPPLLSKTPQFKPSAKIDEVAGVRCRIVLELINGEPAIEHCMANTAALGITERETRTLARLFVLARTRAYDWLGAATKDEDFVSVRSRDLDRGKILTLKSLSTKPLPIGHLRVPKAFKEVELEPAPASAKADPPAQKPVQNGE